MRQTNSFVGYPRTLGGKMYGSIDRLRALGEGCRLMDPVCYGTPFLLFLTEIGIALCPGSTLPIGLVLVAIGLFGTYALTIRAMQQIAFGMGWKPRTALLTAIGSCLLVPVISIPTFMSFPLLALFLPAGTFFCGAAFVIAMANLEMRRYGAAIGPFSLFRPDDAFQRAIEERRRWDVNPFPEPDLSKPPQW